MVKVAHSLGDGDVGCRGPGMGGAPLKAGSVAEGNTASMDSSSPREPLGPMPTQLCSLLHVFFRDNSKGSILQGIIRLQMEGLRCRTE